VSSARCKTGYGQWDASENGTAPAIARIPKDIVICDWHYGQPADFPSIRLFQDAVERGLSGNAAALTGERYEGLIDAIRTGLSMAWAGE
jgi:hypothetical protein